MSQELTKVKKNHISFWGHLKMLCTNNKNYKNNWAQISAVSQEQLLSLHGFPKAVFILKYGCFSTCQGNSSCY